MDIKEFIKQSIIELHNTSSTDKYGQLLKYDFTPYAVFREREGEALEYIKENKGLVEVHSYAGIIGEFKSVVIVDKDLQKACNEAFRSNQNRIRNENNHW